jgi:hypothetical protein
MLRLSLVSDFPALIPGAFLLRRNWHPHLPEWSVTESWPCLDSGPLSTRVCLYFTNVFWLPGPGIREARALAATSDVIIVKKFVLRLKLKAWWFWVEELKPGIQLPGVNIEHGSKCACSWVSLGNCRLTGAHTFMLTKYCERAPMLAAVTHTLRRILGNPVSPQPILSCYCLIWKIANMMI